MRYFLFPVAIAALLTGYGASHAAESKGKPTEIAPPPAAARPAPYDDQLARLSEILGSLDFIRNLCGAAPEPQWKALMTDVMEKDARNEPERKARLTAAFNRGYRTYSAIQTSCNDQLRQTADRYRIEGATLAAEITARFGN